MTNNMQPSILPGIPHLGRYLSFNAQPGANPAAIRESIRTLKIDERMVVGVGEPLVALWDSSIEALRTFPALSGPGVQVPSTQHAMWCWLRGDDRGELVNRSIEISDSLRPGLCLDRVTDGFKFGDRKLGFDLTGYEDGTENPTEDDAIAAAIVQDSGHGMEGSSFVAVQQWVHNLRSFAALPQTEQDHIFGRRKSDNSEIENAPESAHVKRTEQESFTPAAMVLRRSMPFADPDGEGLMFVAFGKTLDAFEVQLRRMAGLEDGITDGVFQFSRAISGSYYWCPPMRDGRLNLTAVE